VVAGDREVPRKQRHTARRVWQRLVAEHGASLAEVTVSRYVARRRVELGMNKVVVAVPQTHLPGAEGEVDFGEFYATIDGAQTKVWMFVMRLSHSGKGVPRRVRHPGPRKPSWKSRSRVCALQRVPGRIRYDNLKPAVVRVLRGRDRAESERFIALRSHYSFGSFFCSRKGGAHERAGWKARFGRFRATTSCRSPEWLRWPR